MKPANTRASRIAFNADPAEEGLRLDIYLADRAPELSRSRAQKLIEEGRVEVNRVVCPDKNYRLKSGDRVQANMPPLQETKIEPERIRLDIVYEDEDLLVVNKPRGMVVHPAPGHSGGTLVNALLYHCSDLSGIGGVKRPGIVHRLDKNTSGLLIVAKNDFAHNALSRQLKTRKLQREYIALVCGHVEPEKGRIEAPVGRHPRHRKKMAVVSGGREAVTRYHVLKYFARHTLVQLRLETGRTHQIRVHMSHIGHPVAGDTVYGRKDYSDLPPGLAAPHALHARRITFNHPRSGKNLDISAPLPDGFKEGLRELPV